MNPGLDKGPGSLTRDWLLPCRGLAARRQLAAASLHFGASCFLVDFGLPVRHPGIKRWSSRYSVCLCPVCEGDSSFRNAGGDCTVHAMKIGRKRRLAPANPAVPPYFTLPYPERQSEVGPKSPLRRLPLVHSQTPESSCWAHESTLPGDWVLDSWRGTPGQVGPVCFRRLANLRCECGCCRSSSRHYCEKDEEPGRARGTKSTKYRYLLPNVCEARPLFRWSFPILP
jgi:hypothetical protein